MSGETEASVSAWTLDTLHAHLSQRLIDLDRLLSRRMDDADKAIQAALVSAEKAVTKAETASERRFEALNEFRGVLTDQQQTLLSRSEYSTAHSGLVDRINALTERITAMDLRLSTEQGHDSGTEEALANASRATNTRLVLWGVIISVIVIAVNVALFAIVHG